jgi:hypothetical protein
MLHVVILNVSMLNVIMLNAIMLNVVAAIYKTIEASKYTVIKANIS